jgi:uncharacterized protein
MMRLLEKTLVLLIKAYRLSISPAFPSSCRFMPTCSHYAQEAIQIHGPGKGILLALKRLLKCHPFHAGGFDSVPPLT